jgi:hypothetical protein
VQVQRPFVLETVSLDLFLGRQLGRFVRNFPALSSRLDIVAILDHYIRALKLLPNDIKQASDQQTVVKSQEYRLTDGEGAKIWGKACPN